MISAAGSAAVLCRSAEWDSFALLLSHKRNPFRWNRGQSSSWRHKRWNGPDLQQSWRESRRLNIRQTFSGGESSRYGLKHGGRFNLEQIQASEDDDSWREAESGVGLRLFSPACELRSPHSTAQETSMASTDMLFFAAQRTAWKKKKEALFGWWIHPSAITDAARQQSTLSTLNPLGKIMKI